MVGSPDGGNLIVGWHPKKQGLQVGCSPELMVVWHGHPTQKGPQAEPGQLGCLVDHQSRIQLELKNRRT